jgi:hypothetical protein
MEGIVCYENFVAHSFSTNGSYMELFLTLQGYCEMMFISALALWLIYCSGGVCYVFLNDCSS